LNVANHHQWAILFILHVNLEFQIPTYNNASSNNEEIHHTPIGSMIHNFLDALKIMDYENIIYYIASNQNFRRLGLFKYKHLKELSFSTLFYGQP
jgi:hypothetical protein